MRYRTIGSDPRTAREVSVLSLGTMFFGTKTDEDTSYALLDRFAEAGGTFLDTANNYAFWVGGDQGGQSEQLLGRWRRRSGPSPAGRPMVIATKVGGRPVAPATDFSTMERLTPDVIRSSAERSLERMGLDHLDLYYAHVQDDTVPLTDQVEAFGRLAADGTVGLLGVSNTWAWRVERARALARAAGLPAYEVLQYEHSYLRPRTDVPRLRAPDGTASVIEGNLLSLVRDTSDLVIVAYSALLRGGYVRADVPLGPLYDHAGTPPRLAALAEVAGETGATANQVVLAYLIGGDPPVIPLVSASSVAQLDESLAAVDLDLTTEQRTRLHEA